MIDKIEYWKRRNNNQRGQDDVPPAKLHPRGTKVEFEDSKGVTKELSNALGSHVVMVKGKPKLVNRRESRSRIKLRYGSAKNYLYQRINYGFKHEVKEIEHQPSNPPGLTNHIRHRERQLKREAIKLKERENAGNDKTSTKNQTATARIIN